MTMDEGNKVHDHEMETYPSHNDSHTVVRKEAIKYFIIAYAQIPCWTTNDSKEKARSIN